MRLLFLHSAIQIPARQWHSLASTKLPFLQVLLVLDTISYIVLLFINAQVMLLGRLMIFYLFTLYVLLINCIYITPACQGSAKAGFI